MRRSVAVFLLICITFLIAPLLSSAENAPSGAAELSAGSLSIWALSAEGDAVTYSLPVFLSNVPTAGLAGLLFSLSLPEGWRILSVELSAEAVEPVRALALTYRLNESGSRATVLLDGCENVTVSTPDACPLLILTVQRSAHAVEPTLTFSVPETGGLYYYNNGGMPEYMPLGSPVALSLPVEPYAPEVPSLPAESALPSTEASTPSVPNDPDPAAAPRPLARYIGCQETAVHDGTYAVRFLFLTPDAAAADTACVWLTEGTGLLPLAVRVAVADTVTVSLEDAVQVYPAVLPDGRAGAWRLYTFEGLSASARYTFAAVGSDGTVYITYDMGKNIKNTAG